MRVEVLPNADSVAGRAAAFIAETSRAAVDERGRFIVALSGGRTPWRMLRILANAQVPWDSVHVAQVDERVARLGDPERNLTHLYESLLTRTPLRPERIYAMPVEADDLKGAAGQYGRTLAELAGAPPVLDLVHLGLGPDGHTTSLVPGDPALDITDADVGVTRAYQGRRRMTLTYPVINRARQILWIVTGSEKAAALARLCTGDRTIPAGRVRADNAVVLADEPAAAHLTADP
jgi:6-phosphogluconolactonase